MKMTPAQLAALAQGDMENFLVAGNPGGIEAQERRGQDKFVNSATLPRKFNFDTKEQFEKIGVKFIEYADDLFWKVILPDGWKKVATDHSMWSKLIDNKGRERASIFYKAAFYDTDAFISLTRRFAYSCEPVCGWNNDYHESEWEGVVKDCDVVIYRTEEKASREPSNRDERLLWCEYRDSLSKKAREWLTTNYPNWEDPTVYWD